MAHTLKQSNTHKPHPTECEACGRELPKRAHRNRCAACIKLAQLLAATEEQFRAMVGAVEVEL